MLAPEKFIFKDLQLKAWDKFNAIKGQKSEAFQHVQLNKIDVVEQEVGKVVCSHPEYITSLSEAKSVYGLYLSERIAASIRKSSSLTMLIDHAFMNEGVMLYLPRGTCLVEPLYIDVVGKAPLHLFVVAEEGVEVKVEMSPKMRQCTIDLNIHKGANVTWRISRHERVETSELIHIESTQQRDSHFTLDYLTVGSKLSRVSLEANLSGEGAQCDFNGFAAVGGHDQVHVYANIAHNAPHTQSNQHIAHLLSDGAKTSFTGKIYVDSIAQQTRAYQLNKNLLLSKDAVAHAKPGLEIFADDVKASHGATIASIDDELRFYFHSRGLSKEDSRKFLIRAFTQGLLGDDSNWQRVIESL